MNKNMIMAGAGAALVLVVAMVLLARKGREAVAAVGQAINPVSTGNVFYQGANAVGNVLTGGAPSDQFSLGSWFGGLFKSDAEKRVDAMLGPLDSATTPKDARVETTTALPTALTRPTLYLGSKGDAVKLVQQKLRIVADGVFGAQTQTAVKAFQRSRGLVVDGIVGASTWAALDSAYWLIH